MNVAQCFCREEKRRRFTGLVQGVPPFLALHLYRAPVYRLEQTLINGAGLRRVNTVDNQSFVLLHRSPFIHQETR